MKTPYQDHWKRRRFLYIPLALFGLLAMSAIVMLLWNEIIPKISGLLSINYWQAMGLLVLSRILFSNFKFRGRMGHRSSYMHPSFKNKLMEMSDEERQQFKNQWKERSCN